VSPRAAVRAAIEALPAGALVLVSRHGDRERLGDLGPLQRGAAPRLQLIVREGNEVIVFRVLP
jgi:hypothetical protein